MNHLNAGKILVVTGAFLLVLGTLILLSGRFTFLNRLPGDIHVERPGFSFHFPIVTCLLLGLLITAIINIILRK